MAFMQRLGRTMRRIGASIIGLVDVRDFMLVAGLGLTGYGMSLVSMPAAYIVPGLILTAIAIFGTR
jgi:hypothetical protein